MSSRIEQAARILADVRLQVTRLVLLRSLVATRWIRRGDEAAIEIEGLGRAAARFA
ncbi:MAG: hypothetical protein HY217_13835 [Candidatus Rokubacteria bacterium]|nr:hypothetical protein [Candidatus Rokubacteria bacterium]